MRFDILTIFPKIIEDYSSESILKRGQKSDKIKVIAHDFRQFATDKHHKVDDTPYGGGPGMVLKVEPIYKCLKGLGILSSRAERSGVEGFLKQRDSSTGACPERSRGGRNDKTKIIILDPAGKKFDQKMAVRFSKLDRLVLICGRYEGFDERVYKFVDEKVSIGDYVLSGGELPALVVLETVARLIPGVIGNPESLKEETFSKKLQITNYKLQINSKFQNSKSKNSEFRIQNSEFVEYPQYTRPENFLGLKVPKILLSGNHKKIGEWRSRRLIKK